MGIAVGIDLGTTNTVVGAVRGGRAATLADESGSRLIPSIVSFHPSGNVVVGEAGKDRRIVDPINTIYSVKRLIGRTWDSKEVQGALKTFPFKLQQGPKQSVTVTSRGETYTLPEISAFVLRRAKQVAEEALGEAVDRAVITVPANFNDLQRAATKLAGKLAGLEVLRILNEPTAAALAYGQASGDRERIAVYDLGGGTFDITLLDLSGNVYEVLATGGDTSLGGDDFDLIIAAKMAQHILQKYRVDARADPTAWAILRSRAEKLKLALSTEDHASIELNDIAYGEGGALLPMTFSMTRPELESLSGPLIARTLDTCRFSLETVGVGVKDLGRLLLVGGATRMPLVVQRSEEYFRRPAVRGVNPDEVVALGAAIQAFSLNRAATAAASRKAPTGQYRAPTGAAAAARRPTSPRQSLSPSTLPVVGGKRKPASEVEAGRRPPPVTAAGLGDVLGTTEEFSIPLSWAEPVALEPPIPPPQPEPSPLRSPTTPGVSASASAPVPTPSAPRNSPWVMPSLPAPPPTPPEPMPAPSAAPLLIDVTPLSLGVEVAGGFTDVLITANTPVPCDRTRVFRTASDGQTAVVIRVAQGEMEKFAANTCLGDVELSGIKAAPRGEVRIEVIFEIDADGILNVRAKDLDSGRETAAKMRLLGAQNDAAEVEQMMSRQERHALE